MTDEDRREVAERLFELSGRTDTHGFDCLLAEAVRGYEFCETPCDECHRRLAAELADLIEPSCDREVPERTCRVVADGTDFFCPACGFSADIEDWVESYSYCPGCGSKVVGDEG